VVARLDGLPWGRELNAKGDRFPSTLVAALAVRRTEDQSRGIASLLSWVAVALIETVGWMRGPRIMTKNEALS